MNKQAFSLVEIIVATGILSIAVFGVYKLIWENTKIIRNSHNYVQAYTLFPALSECIENIGASSFTLPNYHFNFWATGTWCEIGTSYPVIIDNIEYSLSGSILSSSITEIQWNLGVYTDEIGNINQSYTQKKN